MPKMAFEISAGDVAEIIKSMNTQEIGTLYQKFKRVIKK